MALDACLFALSVSQLYSSLPLFSLSLSVLFPLCVGFLVSIFSFYNYFLFLYFTAALTYLSVLHFPLIHVGWVVGKKSSALLNCSLVSTKPTFNVQRNGPRFVNLDKGKEAYFRGPSTSVGGQREREDSLTPSFLSFISLHPPLLYPFCTVSPSSILLPSTFTLLLAAHHRQ